MSKPHRFSLHCHRNESKLHSDFFFNHVVCTWNRNNEMVAFARYRSIECLSSHSILTTSRCRTHLTPSNWAYELCKRLSAMSSKVAPMTFTAIDCPDEVKIVQHVRRLAHLLICLLSCCPHSRRWNGQWALTMVMELNEQLELVRSSKNDFIRWNINGKTCLWPHTSFIFLGLGSRDRNGFAFVTEADQVQVCSEVALDHIYTAWAHVPDYNGRIITIITESMWISAHFANHWYSRAPVIVNKVSYSRIYTFLSTGIPFDFV